MFDSPKGALALVLVGAGSAVAAMYLPVALPGKILLGFVGGMIAGTNVPKVVAAEREGMLLGR